MKVIEIDYLYNTEGLGQTATIHELSEGKRYSVVCRFVAFDAQGQETHVKTLRTDSIERAYEYAQAWTA
jgi:hypothetical protein